MGLKKITYTDQETVITAENLNDIQDAVLALEDGVFMRVASGAPVAIADSSNNKLLGLNIYGKSTQASTPTLTAPVKIDSIGDDGRIYTSLFGKNLFDAGKLNLTSNSSLSIADDGYTIVATGGKATTYASSRYDLPLSLKGKRLCLVADSIATAQEVEVSAQVNVETPGKMDYFLVTTKRSSVSFTVPNDATRITIGVYTNNSSATLSVDNTVTVKGLRLMLEANKADSWTKFVGEQAFALSHILRGIPVTDKAYATYTDASGKMWCADEIDLDRGVYIQRINKKTVTAETVITKHDYSNDNFFVAIIRESQRNATTDCLSTHFAKVTNGELLRSSACVYCMSNMVNAIHVSVPTTIANDIATFKNWAMSNNLVVYHILSTPIETPLTATAEEIAAYKALHTNKPNTVAVNDESAYMSVKYIADTKAYIDNKLSGSSVKASVALPASAWVGSGSIYSQVVKIDGVTKNSQVNLTPSISQMATFYEKDITFITENDGGVVTVYVIGQKPVNDYTIQASIVEVNV